MQPVLHVSAVLCIQSCKSRSNIRIEKYMISMACWWHFRNCLSAGIFHTQLCYTKWCEKQRQSVSDSSPGGNALMVREEEYLKKNCIWNNHCRKASPHVVQPVEHWVGWATTAEKHIRFHSCFLWKDLESEATVDTGSVEDWKNITLVFFQSEAAQFWWACVPCSLSFLLRIQPSNAFI